MAESIERRTFLGGAATALAASSASSAAPADEIRMAFIGVGKRGNAHLGRVLEYPNIKVTAICDIDANARDEAQGRAKRDNPKSFSDYRQVLDLKDVDAVLIATPCDLHAPMAAAALDAGKHVFCEKPLGITPEQVDLVLKAAKRSKAVFQIGLQSRNSPMMRDAVKQIHENKLLGEPFVIKAQRHSTPSKPGAQRRGASGMARLRPAWYDDVKRSGDLIVENAVHNIDVCNWLADSRPVSAYGHGKRYLPEPIPAGTIMMDGFSVEYIYENTMHLDYSQLYLHPRSLKSLKNGMWFVVFGEKGALELTYSSWTFHEMYGDQEPREYQPPTDADVDLNAEAHKEFFAAIREKKQPLVDIKVGAISALTAIMGREAIYQRRMVTWKEMGVTV